MIHIAQLGFDGKTALGLKVELPESPPLMLIVGKRGFLMCGFLNMEAAEKLGVAAAVVSGVTTFEEMLNKEVKAASSKAEALGVKVGMLGKEAVKRFL
ncbi:DUF1805 domain-containing protein [Candidatus Bathyarchaeota archaeon]|nr:MAG: DUF1805 domain-containing protein [Candidatus Bathyarchaeota archaeon]